MSEADIKIAVYQDCIDICKMESQRYGDLPKAGIASVQAKIQDRIEEVMDRECHRKVVEAMAS